MTFRDLLTEKSKIDDLTGATRAASKAKYRGATFEISITQDGTIYWDITDREPDFKTSFPISVMQKYTGYDYTPQIEVKYALKDIAQGKWEPEA